MSDIASKIHLAQAVSQLPVSWYFDEQVFELEKSSSSMPVRGTSATS